MRRFFSVAVAALCVAAPLHAQPLPGTKPLEMQGDLAKQMVEGIDRYLTKATAESVEKRKEFWKPDYSSAAAYEKSMTPNRERLRKILGVVDMRVPVKGVKELSVDEAGRLFDSLAKGRPAVPIWEFETLREPLQQFAREKRIDNGQITRNQLVQFIDEMRTQLPGGMEFVATKDAPALVGEGKNHKVFAVRWSVLPGVFGEGLLLEPQGKPKACVVAIPDADQTPEQISGLSPEVPKSAQFARVLADAGCRVVVPTLVDRKDTYSGSSKTGRFTNQTHREFIYRMSYEMGRHIIGYEIQRALAAVDWFAKDKGHPPIGIYGYGEGGLIAQYCAALDTRISSTVISNHFGQRDQIDREPIYRNVCRLFKEFGDGELLHLIQPRSIIVDRSDFKLPPPPKPHDGRGGAAPGELGGYPIESARKEIERVALTFPKVGFPRKPIQMRTTRAESMAVFLKHVGAAPPDDDLAPPKALHLHDPESRQRRQFDQLVDYTQKLMPDAVQRRKEFVWDKLDTSSLDKFKKSQEPLRRYFHENVIGMLPEPTAPLNPRTRLHHETPKYKAYEVVLDVYEDVFSYGILCVPNDLKPGEKRPVVVCQHGLEGRPTDVVNPKVKTPYYNSFGTQLADQGFIVFAPQNPYIFKNEFRQTVRKANPVQLSLYSFIVRQHERILEWLGALPFVDATRIAYYGLSYGGKVAMRIPSILEGYCLSICSGDFNEWIWKNINLEWVGSYMFSGEYEMYEFDLGNTFNYAEMAALIAPRPFMVERGHNDGVGLDEYVAFEYAKVRRLYAKLGIPERTEIEFFTGGHECRVVGTLAFLRKHLNWPER
jgi:dienelactone hydrolase